jgi:hypothetical protein
MIKITKNCFFNCFFLFGWVLKPPPPPPRWALNASKALKRGYLPSLFLAFSLFTATNAQAVDIGFEFGAGFNTGGNHSSAVEDAYGVDSDGLGLFLELYAGVPFSVTENVIVKPQLSLSFTFVSVEDGYGNTDDYTDTIVIPGVAAEYYINGYKNDSVFIGAEFGVVSASGGSDEYYNVGYSLSGDGVSFGIYGGYAFGSGARFSIGYKSIPVELEYNYGGKKESENFGGLSFLFKYAFFVE